MSKGAVRLEDPREVAAAWSALVEPGDRAAGRLRRELGDARALAWALGPGPRTLPDRVRVGPDGRELPWEVVWQRLRPRAEALDVARDLAELERLGGRLLVAGEAAWPPGLADLGLAEPAALWVCGHLGTDPTVAIVGSRSSTAYGNRVATEMALELAERGVRIVSGGAFGIDAAAHRGAVETGRTVAIMAGGLAHLYPSSHEQLFRAILQRGAIVSEVPPGWRPASWRFVERNRLIAALAQVCVVVEAGRRSGALATAHRAEALVRTVCAVPGPVTSAMSVGCHMLLRNNAMCVRGAPDVMELLGPMGQLGFEGEDVPVADPAGSLPPDQRRVWDALPTRAGVPLESVARVAGLGRSEVLAALTGLQLAGLVRLEAAGWARVRGRRP